MDDDHESIEDKANGNGNRRSRGNTTLTVSEMEERNRYIVRDRLSKQSWSRIAGKYGIKEAQCKLIYAKWRAENRPTAYRGRDPIEIVHDQLEQLESWTEQLADVADESAGTVKIAAINSEVNTAMRAVELMQATGILPHDLGTLRVQLDIQVLAMKLVQALNDTGATPEQKRAVLNAMKEVNGLPEPAAG